MTCRCEHADLADVPSWEDLRKRDISLEFVCDHSVVDLFRWLQKRTREDLFTSAVKPSSAKSGFAISET